jgi:predicted nucleic acid-binding protein
MIVIADTTPLTPPAVFEELRQPETPQLVQEWIADPPAWLQVHSLRSLPEPELDCLDSGEREAITVAHEIHADQLLLDETDARQEAARRKLPFIGTLGVLREAARQDLVELMRSLLEEDSARNKKKRETGE